MEFLLLDEDKITKEDYKIRKELYNKFGELPQEFLSKMRHLQPQIGCFNNCSFCSKFAVCKNEYWNEKSIRNIISAIKYTAKKYTDGNILLAWERNEHRVGVNFPYLDNDIASYIYLDKFLKLCYKELGIKTRISTVGFSRHNKKLNEMHKKIANSDLIDTLAGVRLSITKYGRVWESKNKVSIEEYKQDMINFLEIYKSYYLKNGSGPRKMCVELRYNPLVENSDVIVTNYNKHLVLQTSNYLFISKGENINLKESYIVDPYKHSLELSEDAIMFEEYNLPKKIDNEEELIGYLDNNNLEYKRDVEVYLFSNTEGIYYALNPKIANEGNYGFNIYPKTESRKKSGYLITERFLLNAIYEFKKSKGLNLRSIYTNSTWEDVYKVLDICKKIAEEYLKDGKKDKYNYINKNVIEMVEVYVEALEKAGYPSDCFFDSKFTIDTGTICNLGRAITLFKGITTYVNDPLTPAHERNYGKRCSTMKEENYAWRLGCGFNNKIIIEKLDLFNTATPEGQISYKDKFYIDKMNEKIDNNTKYLYPGEKE